MTKTELREELKALGWSQAELARRVKVAQSTITRWRKVPGPVVAYIRLALDVKQLADKVKK